MPDQDGHEPTPLESEMDARERGEKMPNEIDPVDPDELDGDIEDRDDADIDNDDDVDDEDEYLHNRRQAISKAVDEAFTNLEVKNIIENIEVEVEEDIAEAKSKSPPKPRKSAYDAKDHGAGTYEINGIDYEAKSLKLAISKALADKRISQKKGAAERKRMTYGWTVKFKG